MIGGDRVSNIEKAVSILDVWNWRESSLSCCEEWRVVDVSRFVVPRVKFASWGIEVLPHLASFKDVFVRSSKLFSGHSTLRCLSNLFTSWPDVSKEDVLSIFTLSKWLRFEVEVN